ncbi:MAG: HD domain-containing protein [Muricoprocola sp.]
MNRINAIYTHPLYRQQFLALQEREKDRVFCRHTMEHFLDVARLMYIRNLEEQAGLPKELIYAAALTHDIGRNEQYVSGEPHEEAGARLAGEILKECGFREEEIQKIQTAILSHRGSRDGGLKEQHTEKLSQYLYWADKKSRNCFSCPAQEECNWSEEKKNLKIEG